MDGVHPLAAYRARQVPPLSQRDLARLLNVSRETIWRWETGARMPDPHKIPLITAKTGIPGPQLRPDLAEMMGDHPPVAAELAARETPAVPAVDAAE